MSSALVSESPPLDLAAADRQPLGEVFAQLGTSEAGLSQAEAASRLGRFGANVLATRRMTALGVLARQVRNPLLVLLVGAAGVSAFTGDVTNAAIIGVIVGLSVGLGFVNEYRSELAVAALHANIRHEAVVWRDGVKRRVDVQTLVPGDVGAVGVGDVLAADM